MKRLEEGWAFPEGVFSVKIMLIKQC